MATWRCVKFCGACCHLDPGDRPKLEDYLTPEELTLYLSLVGEGGWCVYYDQSKRECSIYEQRPRFCQVTPDNFARMYGVSHQEFNNFAIKCCRQQIAGVYGRRSEEMERYNKSTSPL